MENLLIAIGAFLFGFFSKSLYDQTYLLMTRKVIANIPETDTPPPIPMSELLTPEEEELFDYLKKHLRLNTLKLTDRFDDDFPFDSLDAIELLMLLEDVYGLDIMERDIKGIKTVKDVIDYIMWRLDV